MAFKTNSAGTLAELFQIGKGGPALRQGSAIPNDNLGNNGDLFIRSGSTPGTYVKQGGVWRILTPEALPRTGGTISGDLAVMGNFITSSVTHYGLTPTPGTNIDQIVDNTASLTLSRTWQTAWSPTLADGSYWFQVRVTNSTTGRSDVATGVMSWFPTGTDNYDGRTEEIVLHRSSLASTSNTLYARVKSRSGNSTTPVARAIQVSDAIDDSTTSQLSFRVRRIL